MYQIYHFYKYIHIRKTGLPGGNLSYEIIVHMYVFIYICMQKKMIYLAHLKKARKMGV